MLEKLKPHQTKLIVQIMIGVFALFLLYALRIFMDAFLSAVIIYVLFMPMQKFFTVRLKMRRGLAAVLVIAATFFIVVIPIGLMVSYVVPKLIAIISDSAVLGQAVDMVDQKMRLMLGENL